MATWLDFLNTTDSELDLLAQSCDPATFGLNQQDVLNESYRKAFKMDRGKFCATFDLEESQILKRFSTELLEGADGMKSLTAQLYKLNVYGMSLAVKPWLRCLL